MSFHSFLNYEWRVFDRKTWFFKPIYFQRQTKFVLMPDKRRGLDWESLIFNNFGAVKLSKLEIQSFTTLWNMLHVYLKSFSEHKYNIQQYFKFYVCVVPEKIKHKTNLLFLLILAQMSSSCATNSIEDDASRRSLGMKRMPVCYKTEFWTSVRARHGEDASLL